MRFKKNKKDKTIGWEMKLEVMTRKFKARARRKNVSTNPKSEDLNASVGLVTRRSTYSSVVMTSYTKKRKALNPAHKNLEKEVVSYMYNGCQSNGRQHK